MTEAVRPDWQQRRNRGVHITIRDVDCAEFEVEAMIATYARWHVTCFSFFTAGYVTTYPTRQALQRVSPWLGDRDLTGEIIAVFHHCGIKAILMIDTGQLPEAAYLARPERAARNSAGEAMRATDGDLYRACPLGGYIREYSRAMIAELAERYELDGVKFGGRVRRGRQSGPRLARHHDRERPVCQRERNGDAGLPALSPLRRGDGHVHPVRRAAGSAHGQRRSASAGGHGGHGHAHLCEG